MCFAALSPHVYAAEPTPFKSDDGGFSVTFPSAPKESVRNMTIHSFTFPVHTFYVTAKDKREYAVTWSEYPSQITDVLSPDKVYLGIIAGYETGGKKILSKKEITINGKAGRELEGDVGDGTIYRVRFAMAGNRLYQVATYASKATRDDPAITKFLDSFKILHIHNFPQRGFRIEGAELKGWKSSLRDKAKTAVQWLGPGSTFRKIDSLITIETGKPTDQSAEKAAQSIADQWGGTVSPQKILLDGVEAFRIEAPGKAGQLSPVLGIVAMHRGYIYMIFGVVTGKQECKAEIDEIIKGWKWQEFVDASHHLEAAVDEAPLFGVFFMKYPKDMYFIQTNSPERAIDLGLHDMQAGYDTLHAFVQLVPLQKDANIDAVKDDFLAKINAQKITDQPLTWRKQAGDPTKFVTSTLPSSASTKIAKRPAEVKFALIQLNSQQLVLINFTIVPGNDADKKARYDAAAEAIVDSIRLPVAVTPTSLPRTPK
jgi:hypothetical protein